jgi:predicted small lipoprotein YifL
MSTLKSALALVVLVTVAGCAATGPLYSEIAATIPPVPASKGRVYFYRADTIVGAALTSDISLNGRIVGKSERGGFFYVDEDPGSFKASASTEVERQLTFTLAAGETKYIKSSTSFGVLVGRINLGLVSPDEAKAEIAGLHYTEMPQKK